MPRGRKPTACTSASRNVRRLFSELIERKIQITTLAEQLGVEDATVSRWKSGRTTPSILHMEEFADFLGMNLE